ncbi:hypothetical protein [Duganella violaceipulchra]|uniref:Uncharacterized protein n=1 Tax=Duganella violaceipulchra TaxID=2849652 RepID=A0AA41HDS0_9BURK|nr:hypothetical protein [Duganella violaceicalia]MBV6321953.1 hypothetical protein [Duganella violaceicalia]MCP2007052.1 hypothetical protein [Duganella violaceicalia]
MHQLHQEDRPGDVMITRTCIPSKESGTHRLTQGNLPDPSGPGIETGHAHLATPEQLKALEKVVARLPESYLSPS